MQLPAILQLVSDENRAPALDVKIAFTQNASITAYRAATRYFLNPPAYSHAPVLTVQIVLNDEWYVDSDGGRRRLIGPTGRKPLSLDDAVRAGVARVL